MAAAAIPISFTESKTAFVKRALEVGLVQAEVDHLVAAHVDSSSRKGSRGRCCDWPPATYLERWVRRKPI